MKIKDQEKWDVAVAANQDSYGKGIKDFAERWANLMETKIKSGKQLDDFAKATSHDADTDGITGFMYGCAVGLLSQTWEYGEQLRRWHNIDTQIGEEGKKANKSGGVLNPALLGIASDD